MFCFYTKYYGKVIYSNSQLKWFIIFSIKYMIELRYVVRDTEKCSTPCTIFLSILLQNGIFLKTANGYYCFIVVLSNDYETNLHFIFVWTAELKISWNCPTFLVRNRPYDLSYYQMTMKQTFISYLFGLQNRKYHENVKLF